MAKKLNIDKNSYVYGLLIISLIIVIVLGAFVIRPVLQDNKKQQIILDNRKKVEKTLESKKESLEKLSEESDDLKEKSEKINMAIPDTEDRKSIVFQLYSIAALSSIKLDSINTDAIAIDPNGIEVPISLSSSREVDLSISMKEVTYKSLIQFVDYSKKALRLFNIKKISITGADNNFDVSMVVSVYTSGEGEVE